MRPGPFSIGNTKGEILQSSLLRVIQTYVKDHSSMPPCFLGDLPCFGVWISPYLYKAYPNPACGSINNVTKILYFSDPASALCHTKMVAYLVPQKCLPPTLSCVTSFMSVRL